MDTLISKSTFYDAVSMIIPGFITLFSLAQIFNLGCSYFTNKTLAVPYYICIFAMSYLVGLLIHRFSQCCFDRCLRNNPKHIKAAKEKLIKEIKERGGEPIPETTKNEVEDYYENYYEVIEKSPSISVMEAQVSFIRSMLIVFAIIIFALVVSLFNIECFIDWIRSHKKFAVIILLVILGVLLKFLMFSIQKNIYYRVFEDSYYLDILNAKTSLQGGSLPTGTSPTSPTSPPSTVSPTGSQPIENNNEEKTK